MGIEQLQKKAQEYFEAKKEAEKLKPEDAITYSIDGNLGEILGYVAYYPLENNIRISGKNDDIKIPARAVHSLKVIFEKLDS